MQYPPIGNLPPPPDKRIARFPLRYLQPGQSFAVPLSEERALRRAAANYNATHRDQSISVRTRERLRVVRPDTLGAA